MNAPTAAQPSLRDHNKGDSQGFHTSNPTLKNMRKTLATKEISFYRGAALDGHRFASLACFEKVDKVTFQPSGKFSFDVFDLRSESWTHLCYGKGYGQQVAAYRPHDDQPAIAVALNLRGHVFIERRPMRHEDLSAHSGYTTAIASVGRQLYVLGYPSVFLHRSAEGQWERLADTPKELLYTLVGTGHEDLYIGGHRGTLLHFDGKKSTRLNSGTDVTLTGCHLDSNGDLYLSSGQPHGSVIKGNRRDGFTTLLQKGAENSCIGKVTTFSGRLYFCDQFSGLYELRDGRPIHVELPAGPSHPGVFKVEAIDGVLWVLQATRLHRFDGKAWRTFVYPHAHAYE